ncbi:Uncharacterized membrane protein [Lachnospiraceae bacterium KHCPX20]|nr:Uncharacterized membrane protein [Lachnospiraceae bacterium KHCPX20]
MLLTMQFGWLGYLFLALLFAGFAFVFAKIALQGLSAPQAVLIAGGTMLLLRFTTLDFRGFWHSASQISPEHWVRILLYGALLAAAWITFYLGLQMTNCVAVAPFALLVPVVSYLMTLIIKRSISDIPKLIMWCVLTVGVLLMGFGREHKNKTWWIPTILSPILYGLLLFGKKHYPVSGKDTIVACATLLVMCVIALVASFVVKHGDIKKLTVYHVLFAVLAAICLYYAPVCYGMTKGAPYRNVLYFVYSLWILVTILGSRLFHKERLTMVSGGGLGLIVAAIAYHNFFL